MKKLASIATVSLLALTISACGNSNDKKETSKSNPTAKVINNSKVTMDKYKNIKLSNLIDNSGGTPRKEVINQLGKPSTKTTSDMNGKKMITYTWNKLNDSFKAKNMSVSFSDDKAMTKNYANLDLSKMKPLDPSKTKTIKKGDSYNSLISKLGNPSAESEAGSGNMAMKETIYLTSTKGDATGYTLVGNDISQITTNRIR